GAQANRLLDDQVDELDDGGIALLEGGAAGESFRLGEVDGGVGELRQHRVDRLRLALAVVAVDRLDDLLARGEDGLYIFVQNELEFLNGVEVGGVAHDDFEGPVVLGHGQDDVLAGDRFGDEFDDGGRNGDLGEVNELQAVVLGDGAHDLVGSGVAEFDDGIGELHAGLAFEAAGLFELVGAEG